MIFIGCPFFSFVFPPTAVATVMVNDLSLQYNVIIRDCYGSRRIHIFVAFSDYGKATLKTASRMAYQSFIYRTSSGHKNGHIQYSILQAFFNLNLEDSFFTFSRKKGPLRSRTPKVIIFSHQIKIERNNSFSKFPSNHWECHWYLTYPACGSCQSHLLSWKKRLRALQHRYLDKYG